MANVSAYDTGLDRNEANYTPLSPLSQLARTAYVYPQRPAVIHGERSYTWSEIYARCRRLGSALQRAGIGRGDTVATMLPNVPAMYEAHFGVAMAGAVVNTLNTRLDAESIAFMLGHAEAKVLLTDREFSSTVDKALRLTKARPLVIDVDDVLSDGGVLLGDTDYERFIAQGDPRFAWSLPADEWDAISLNYTSGTTGNPKGVVYHHRGAYLNALGNALAFGLSAALCSLPGCLSALRTGNVTPDSANITVLGAITFLVIMVVGGAGSLWGPIVGSVLFVFITELTGDWTERSKVPALLRPIFGWSHTAPGGGIFAVMLIVLMFVAPFGIVGMVKRLVARFVTVVPAPAGTGTISAPDAAPAEA